jgi:outer membrane protein OmpA-like peptidoglycan-associated protein
MRNKTSTAGLVAIALLFLSLMAVKTSAQNATNVHALNVAQGEKQKIQGVVSIRNGDSFKVRDTSGGETTVLLSSNTDVTSHARGLRGKKDYPVTYIMRGLRVQAQGRGDADGNLLAEWVRFDEQDLRSAQALEQTAELATDNEERIAAAEKAAEEAAAEARRMAGQIAENTALANDARARADAAQAQADAAFKSAALANNRINGLDEYETLKNIPVLFKLNSSKLDVTAMATIDEAAAWAKAEKGKGNANGWLVQVVGYADKTGKSAKNRALSDRRADAVIQYLVLKHGMDLRRLVQPFGYGENNPAADNSTAAGRAQNRRVEIRILQNKGIAMKS